MIGKIFAVFSNDWKIFFQWLENSGDFFQWLENGLMEPPGQTPTPWHGMVGRALRASRTTDWNGSLGELAPPFWKTPQKLHDFLPRSGNQESNPCNTWLTVLPSARWAIRGLRADISLPISFLEVMPVEAMVSRARASISSRESGAGR